jgi:hypothetical protein
VGALRAAEHIAQKTRKAHAVKGYELPNVRYGCSNIAQLRTALQQEMSRVADFDRDTEGMQALLERVSTLCDEFFDTVVAENVMQHAELFKLYDMLLSQRAVLSAMLCAAREFGTHGAALIDRKPARGGAARQTRTLTRGARSHTERVSPIPSPELWFETLLARKRQELQDEKHI